MGYVRAYRAFDESDLAPRLRLADLQEIAAGSGRDPEEVLREGAEQSALSCTVIGNHGYVAAMFGVVGEGEFGRIWLVGSDELVQRPLVRQFLKECPAYLDVMCRPYQTVGNFILETNSVHMRWLAFMGFTFKRRIENYGLRGEAYIEFSKDGLTVYSHDSMLAAQGGACAICKGTHSGNRRHKALPIDHDHVTGKVRGILCDECNVGLARFKDNPEHLVTASKYLLEQKG